MLETVSKTLVVMTTPYFYCRKSNLKNSLQVLREEVLKAKALVREANDLSQEMGKKTEFQVTLQIPANSLSPNRRVCPKTCYIYNRKSIKM